MADVKRVLHVEDAPDDAALVAGLLEQAGGAFAIEVAPTLAAALTRLERGAVDVVLLDLGLPDSQGLATLSRLRRRVRDVPVVVCTGAGDETLARDSVRRGAQDFLVKDDLGPALLARSLVQAIARSERERRHLEAHTRLRIEVARDPLTRLLNRRGLQAALDRLAQRPAAPVAALLLDVDDFKRVNEERGHLAGDQVLQEVAHRVRAGVRPSDFAARIGGDEFLVVLPGATLEEARHVAERLRLALGERPIQLPSGPLRITASLGLSTLPAAPATVADLIDRTQLALQRSKHEGKYRVAVAEARDPLDDARALVLDLRRGRQLGVVQQPLVRLEDGEVVGWELLVRGPPGPYERPDDLFRLSREHDALVAVDRAALTLCARAAAAQGLPRSQRVHLNLDPLTLLELPWSELEAALAPCRGAPLALELSERNLLGVPLAPLAERASALRQAGLTLTLDHVGFGGTPLESLILLRPQLLKIDRSWTDGVGRRDEQAQAVRRLAAVAAALGTEVAAIGIEREEDRRALLALGVKLGQGFLLGRPARVA